MTDAINLPVGLDAGTDWSATLQKIAAYGAGRLFDSQAVKKIYESSPTPVNMDDEGNFYTTGQKKALTSVNSAPLGVPLLFWLVGGVAVFLLMKD